MTEARSLVYVSLGSNIEPERHLQAAVNLLRECCELLAISSVYRSPPFGFTEQPDFLDIAVQLATTDEPAGFKRDVLDDIERCCGRDRAAQASKFGPLPLDIDILLWDDDVFTFGAKPWRVPDPNILRLAAVAVPLAEIAPEYVHPEAGLPLAEIAAQLVDETGPQRVAFRIV
jgi:2-amino-4-hydroxy-6-hydroxymethyldihydropteridine diphosphokinase